MITAVSRTHVEAGRPRAARAYRLRRPLINWILTAALALLGVLFALPALAAFTPPPLYGHMVDTAGKLTDADVRYLDRKLDRIRSKTGFEIVAFIVGSLEGETVDDVAYKAFNTWEIGRKGDDNGVLLVISPSDRKVRIETGKGVGGALTDLQSDDIIRQRISPLLQEDRFRDAIDQGTTAIARTLSQGTAEGDKPLPPTARERRSSPLNNLVLVGIGIVVIILSIVSPTFRHILFFFLLFGRGGGGGGFGGGGFGGGGSGYRGGGGRSGGGGASGDY